MLQVVELAIGLSFVSVEFFVVIFSFSTITLFRLPTFNVCRY